MIVCCGEALIDFMPISAEGTPAFRPLPGGSPFNVAIGLGRLGAPAGFLSRISTDFFGDLLMRTLGENRVDARYVKRAADPTMLAFVSHRPDGEPQYAFFANGAADRCITENDLPTSFADDVACLHLGLGAISTQAEPAATTFEALLKRESKRRILAFDPNVPPQPDQGPRYRAGASGILDCALRHREGQPRRSQLALSRPQRRGFRRRLARSRAEAGGDDPRRRRRGRLAERQQNRPCPVARSGWSIRSAPATVSIRPLLAGLNAHGLLTRDRLAKLDTGVLQTLLDRAVAAAAITCSRAGANPPTQRELEDFLGSA